MAVCLGCGSRNARVLWSRSAVVVEESEDVIIVERICRRTTACHDCGERRSQRIVDEGKAVKAHPDGSDEYRVRR